MGSTDEGDLRQEPLIGVVAHSSREAMARELVAKVGAEVLSIDSNRSPHLAESACRANHYEVLRRLRARSGGHAWVLVLEDDAVPIDGFREHAAAALSCARAGVVGFYVNRAGVANHPEAMTEAERTGAAWLVKNDLVSGLAYAIRADLLPGILRWPGWRKPRNTLEMCLTGWAHRQRSTPYGPPRFFYTVPSLVDHWEGRSLIYPDPPTRERRAYRVGVAPTWDTHAVEYDPGAPGRVT